MGFKDLSYKKPKGTVKNNVKKSGSRSAGKNVQGQNDSIQEAAGKEPGDTGNS